MVSFKGATLDPLMVRYAPVGLRYVERFNTRYASKWGIGLPAERVPAVARAGESADRSAGRHDRADRRRAHLRSSARRPGQLQLRDRLQRPAAGDHYLGL